jgi:hypothetical protein
MKIYFYFIINLMKIIFFAINEPCYLILIILVTFFWNGINGIYFVMYYLEYYY